MSMLTELFTTDAMTWSLEKLKREIRALPRVQQERRSYILKDWAAITGNKLTPSDFEDVGA